MHDTPSFGCNLPHARVANGISRSDEKNPRSVFSVSRATSVTQLILRRKDATPGALRHLGFCWLSHRHRMLAGHLGCHQYWRPCSSPSDSLISAFDLPHQMLTSSLVKDLVGSLLREQGKKAIGGCRRRRDVKPRSARLLRP
jgi:hypothetical protein